MGTDELVDILLDNRGLKSDFLDRIKSEDIKVSDFGINTKDFEKAIKIIKAEQETHQKILIYGDYDVDGITATALVWKALYKKNKNVLPFIPDRQIDGYGLNDESVIRFCKEKNFWPDLLITVDNGIVAYQQIKKLKNKIGKVVVIDHHQKGKEKLEADGVVYSDQTTASVLAYLVAREFDSKTEIDLAALGVIADCANLANKLNRNLVAEGLKKLNLFPNIGIKEILKVSKWGNKVVDEWTIGFVIAPRINASGRMGDATRALRLLCDSNKDRLEKIATDLEKENRKRQDEQNKKLESYLNHEYKQDLIIVKGDIHPGIIGLIAGKLTEKFGKASIVISEMDGKIFKASGRSIDDFDITKFLRQYGDLYESIGGHSQACGFGIKSNNYSRWYKLVKETKIKGSVKNKSVEAIMTLGAVNIKNFEAISKLKPWGEGNPLPYFLFTDVNVVNIRWVGANKNHVQLQVRQDRTVNAIGFNMANVNLSVGTKVNLIGQLTLNEYNGSKTIQIQVQRIC